MPRLQAQLEEQGLDPRVKIKVRGETEDQDESEAFLEQAFVVALFVMGIILVTQFNSFYQAFLILSAVLFSTVGVSRFNRITATVWYRDVRHRGYLACRYCG